MSETSTGPAAAALTRIGNHSISAFEPKLPVSLISREQIPKEQNALRSAGAWFLNSGIQADSGGVARYFDAAKGAYRAVSTEITGYAARAFTYLYSVTGEEAYLDRALLTAQFLVDHSWDEALQTFPFEHPSPSGASDHHAYFFDCGIIIRGLLAVWRITKEDRLFEIAASAARGMVESFHSGRDYHPIISLPGKDALARDDRWSRSPGCYQLKAAVAWWEVAKVNGDAALRDAFLEMLDAALIQHTRFLPGVSEKHRVMDRLHAYGYFLEGLVVVAEREDCRRAYADGLRSVGSYLLEIAPTFARCDVYSQLLRARINGELLGVCPIDAAAAAEEAAALASFQRHDPDPRISGGFAFGRREGSLVLHMNPWATAFALQALEMWRRFQSGSLKPCPELLI